MNTDSEVMQCPLLSIVQVFIVVDNHIKYQLAIFFICGKVEPQID